MGDTEPVYISLGRWTRGWSGAGDFPSTQARSKELWDVDIERFFWVVSGDYDTIAITRGESRRIARCKLATSRLDRVRTTLLTAVETYRSDVKPAEGELYLGLGCYRDSTSGTPGIKAAKENAERLIAIQTEAGTMPLASYAIVAGGAVDVVTLCAAGDIRSLADSRANLAAEVGLQTSLLWVLPEIEMREVEGHVMSAVGHA